LASPQARDQRRDWYTLSVDTLRGWGIVVVILVAGVGGFFGYRQWERFAVERDAGAVIDEDRVLLERLATEAGLEAFRNEYLTAQQTWQEARTLHAQAQWKPALGAGRRSRALLLSISDALRSRGAAGEAQFVSAQGGVQFRRGEAGDWDDARGRVVLRSGDYVKTSGNGSAEIMFTDGTLYTVRPNTLFLVTATRQDGASGPSERSIRMEYGWVNLSTAQRPATVSTPGAQARVRESSEASVAYDQATASSRFSALRGGLHVETSNGSAREVGELEQVVQTGAALTEPKSLPAPPQLGEPADNLEVNLDRVRELAFSWQPVAGAARYAFQVSRSRLFVDNLIDADNRTKARATLGVRGEGNFLWRVAAFGKDGAQGPWSTPRRLRIASQRAGGGEADKTPPQVDLEDVRAYGSIVIMSGRTEPGATIEVNGEDTSVGADGTFTKTVQLAAEGWSFVEIRARDAWGNETVRKQRVYVEGL
jgi:hypothetical protein